MRTIQNTFYTDFDLQTLGERHSADFRTPFQIDRDRIIYSSSFRRLQSKTQVFLSGEYDFYRTRLTHTLEVAQIARSITHYLLMSSPYLSDDFFIDPDLVEAIALAHDLGHPPFGHTGEKMLHDLMKENWGGFEGNAQSVRIITELIFPEKKGRKGMSPTRAFLDGIMKYKVLYREKDPDSHKYLYDDQEKYLRFVYPDSVHGLLPVEARRRSVECQIMDWADNTAYSIHDLIDGYKAGFISLKKVEEWATDHHSWLNATRQEILKQFLQALQHDEEYERFMARQIGGFIRATSLDVDEKSALVPSNRYRFRLRIDPYYDEAYRVYSKLAVDLIFSHPAIQQLEFKGKKFIKKIFEALIEEYVDNRNPHVLLPPNLHQAIVNEKEAARKYRLICDHIAGMTDAYLMKTYKKLFDPDFGSIIDLIE